MSMPVPRPHPDPLPQAGGGAVQAPPGPWREFWGSFSANAGAVAGLATVLVVILLALFAPWIAPYAPQLTDSSAFLKPPAWQAGGTWAHPLGTDAIGRDLLSRLIHGARLSCTSTFSAWPRTRRST